MKWFVFSRKWLYVVIIFVLLLTGAGYFLLGALLFPRAIQPQELFQQSIARTKAAKSYSYSIKTQLVTRQGTRCLSELTGARVLPDKVCAKGKIFNSPVEIVQVKGMTYIKDRYSSKWLTLEGDRLGETGVFIAELDPLVVLDFQETPAVVKGKRERGEKMNLLVLEFSPQVKNRFLAAQFTDFSYRLYVDPKDHYITEIRVEARSKEASTKLVLNLGLCDFDKQVKIEPPRDAAIN
ncbi:MAG: hypothetical protein AB1510_13050 [Bacillota bacterium]